MTRFLQCALLLGAAIALAGCATRPANESTKTAPGGNQVKNAPAGAKAEHIAESWIVKAQQALIAGRMDEAARDYLKAASKSTQPQVAAQATALAWHTGDAKLAEKAAKRWRALKPDAPGPHHFLAVLALDRHDLDTATEQFQALLEAEPRNDFEGVADALVAAGSPYEAFVVMRRLESGHAGSAEAKYALARLAARADHTRFAREKVAGALELRPNWMKALMLRAQLLIDAGQPKEALAPVRALSEAAPGNIELKIRYAELLFAADRSDDARSLLRGILADNPLRRPEALLLLAVDRLDQKDKEQAGRYLTLLLESGKKRAEAYYYLGELAARDKDYRMALDWLGRINDTNRSAADELAVASVLERMKKPEAARQFLADAREHDPRHGNALAIGEARLLIKQGRPDAALDLLAQALEPRPKDTELLYARGMLAARVGRNKQALADVQHVVRLEPENTAALNALGYMLTEHTSHYRRARRYIEKALNYSPHNAAIIDSLGWVEFHQGDNQAALKTLQHAHRLNDDPEISAHLVAVLRATGERKKARQVLERALKAHPDAKSLKQLKAES